MSRARASRVSFHIGTAAFGLGAAAIFGLALFFGIADIGLARIAGEVIGVGFGLLGIVAVHLGQLGFCTLAWRGLFIESADSQRPHLPGLFALRWIRESVDSLLPVAQVGGLLVSVRHLARGGSPLPVAGASIIADVTIETLSQVVFTLLGLALIFTLTNPGDVAQWAVLGLVVAAAVASVAVLAQRWGGVGLFEKLLLFIAARMGWNKLEGVAGLDDALKQMYQLRGRLMLTGFHHLMAWSLGAGEVMIAAWALGYRLDLGQSYAIESMAQAVRSAAFFVPGALGVQEGGFVLVAGLFGVPADAAISISLSKRVRELALGLPGLATWQWQAFRRRHAKSLLEMDADAA